MSDGEPIVTLKLAYPFEIATGTLTELRFLRRVMARDLVRADIEKWGDNHNFDMKLLAELTGIPKIQLEGKGENGLNAYDFNRASGVLAGFMLTGPRTGQTSSDGSPDTSGSDEGSSSS
jgi:hypothetical protein